MAGALIQNGKQAFTDANSRPLAGGRVYFYSVGTQTPKDTYQDANMTILNTNPIILDARGEASIYGSGAYRQVLKDASLNQIWDQTVPDVAASLTNFLSSIGNSTDLTQGAALVGRATMQINSLAELRTISGRYNNDMVFVERYAAGYNAGGGNFVWDAASVLVDNNVTIILPTGSTSAGRWLRIGGPLMASMFGCKPTAGFDNVAGLAAIEAFLRAELAAFRPLPSVWFEAGTYTYSVAPNFGIQGATILNQGKVKMRCTGTGSAMTLDAGVGTGVNLTSLTFGLGTGFIFECGPTATAATVYIRDIYLSEIRCRVWGAGTSQAGFGIFGCVLSRFWIGCTPTESAKEVAADYINGWYLGGKPTSGMTISQSAAATQSAYCTFYDWIGAACQYGMYVDSTLGCSWSGGDNEYNTVTGAVFTGNAIGNRVLRMNFEVNTTDDVECAGNFNEFDCDSTNFRFIGGSGNKLIGGMHDQITIAGGTGNYVGQVTYGRGISGNLVIADSGTNSSFGPCYQAQSQRWSNGPSKTGTISLGASPYSYVNTTGRKQKIVVVGSATINYYSGATLIGPVPVNAPVDLAVGDTLSITYTGAPTVTYVSN